MTNLSLNVPTTALKTPTKSAFEANRAIRSYLPDSWVADYRGQMRCCYLDTASSHSPHHHEWRQDIRYYHC